MNVIKAISISITAAVLLLGGPSAALAQNGSSPMPSYATSGGDTIRGTIASIDGKYALRVRDDRGFIDNVTLHDGTIINPTGLKLAPGQSVTIAGVPSGRTFVANEIDTPYVFYGYPYAYYPYPYGPYAVGLRFGGPRFGFGFRGRI